MKNLDIILGGKDFIKKRHPKTKRVCINCKKEFYVWQSRIKIGKGKFCSIRCGKIGKNNYRWQGGFKYINGYKFILVKDHPRSSRKGYVKEHQIIMEKYIGRLLNKGEVIHHLNGIRDDNRIENLLLLSGQDEHMKLHRDNKGRFAEINKNAI